MLLSFLAAMLLTAGVVLGPVTSGQSASAAPAPLLVGVGQADITPITGGYKGGWACSCAKAQGVSSRLYAHVVVLERGTTKVALVTEDLAFLDAGMIRDAAKLLPGRGFNETNILDGATHTHSSQMGFMNFAGYNSVFPKVATLTEFNLATAGTDQVMYNFMTRQLAAAIRQADDHLAPGAVGWGHATLAGITQNRSLEAHLADYGYDEPVGTGKVSQDPHGYLGTIDPEIDLLRVDQDQQGRLVPVGVFTTFANHGTVVKSEFFFMGGDHQAVAERDLSARIRRAGGVPAGQQVVTAFANSDAGDMSSGLHYSGPADAEFVGLREADAMFTAWRAAGSAMTRTPALALRWTRICMCGQSSGGHASDSTPILGAGQAAGSEEGRTVFGDAGIFNEGQRLPADIGPQGRKVQLLRESGNLPGAVPLTALQIGDRVIVTWPGEATVGVGRLVRAAVAKAVAGTGIKGVVFFGYEGEYLDYWTTPQEYEMQHYEGGSTVYGEYASLVVRDAVADLAHRLMTGQPAPKPYAYDPNRGVHVTSAGYGPGSDHPVITAQPAAAYARLAHPTFAWTGGGHGVDRPVGTEFIAAQRWVRGRWVTATDDLGLQIIWSGNAAGQYRAWWEVPASAPTGTWRFLVTAKRYTIASRPFRLAAATTLTPVVSGSRLAVDYPRARVNLDWTWRPAAASGITVTFVVDGRTVVVHGNGSAVAIPAGTSVVVPAGGARDGWGNTNAARLVVR